MGLLRSFPTPWFEHLQQTMPGTRDPCNIRTRHATGTPGLQRASVAPYVIKITSCFPHTKTLGGPHHDPGKRDRRQAPKVPKATSKRIVHSCIAYDMVTLLKTMYMLYRYMETWAYAGQRFEEILLCSFWASPCHISTTDFCLPPGGLSMLKGCEPQTLSIVGH